MFGTVGEVCCFLYELILCKHSTTPVGHLALACDSLQRMKEVDNEVDNDGVLSQDIPLQQIKSSQNVTEEE